MKRIRLNLKGLTVPGKVEFARQIVSSMNGNPNFPSPVPSMADITNAADALETAFNDARIARSDAEEKTSMQSSSEESLNLLLSQLANYVEIASNNDEVKMKSSGMEVKSKGAPIGELPAPENAAATMGDNEGEIDLSWDSVSGARSYIIEQSPNPVTATSWMAAGNSTRSGFTAGGLTSGAKFWFRIAALGSAGQGPWSNPVTKIVP